MALKLFNTLTREKEKFQPIEEGKVKFYSCGQTIYDDLHIGNARPYAVWDTFRRYLEWKGYDVRHVQNITDVGHLTDDADQGQDKVEKRAESLGIEPMELVEDQIERYFEDTKALNVERQDIVPRATGHINEMVNYVQKIINNGYAYEVEGNIYFDLEKFSEDYSYGEMAKKDIEQLKEQSKSRVKPDSKKKNQYDFALWLSAEGTNHLMRWEARFEMEDGVIVSEGYPGWHLECSVMGQKYLGEEFDIHAGGKDHIFPHHPNERAQCLAATGKNQARYWLHNEFLKIEGEKMSKSESNFYTVRELLNEGYSGDAIRLYLISSHYRSETDFSKEGLEKAEKELLKVRRTVKKADTESNKDTSKEIEDRFEKLMDEDIGTAKAKQYLMEKVSDINKDLEENKDVESAEVNTIIQLFDVLGVNVRPEENDTESSLVELLVEIREKVRNKEDYDTSDLIREKLKEIGFEIEDKESKTVWYKK